MLAGILVVYVLVIGFADNDTGSAVRVGLLGFLLWTSTRLHHDRRVRRAALITAVGAFVTTSVLAYTVPFRVTYGVVGVWTTLMLGVAVASIVLALLERPAVDTATVLGVLNIYLLLALIYSGVHEVLAAFQPHYLNGAVAPPTSSDLLYFSVITITTVGYGDITPACVAARAVAVLEAMTGQLYLVSVVAGVVGGWRVGGGRSEQRPDG
jgi:hypothetical protein